SAFVSKAYGAANLFRVRNQRGQWRGGALGPPGGERLSFPKLHALKNQGFFLAQAVNSNYFLVGQASRRLCFLLEPLDQFFAVGSVATDGNGLECDGAPDELVERFINHSHRPASQLSQDLVASGGGDAGAAAARVAQVTVSRFVGPQQLVDRLG